MSKHPLWILLFFICAEAAEELIFSHVVFRHGERAPSDPFKNAPYGEETWPFGIGRITYRGLHNQVELGRWLRKHYIEDGQFMSQNYNYSEIYVRSSDHSRAIQSAAAFLSGLYGSYPKDTTAVGGIEFPAGFAPIPVYSIDAKLDKANRPIPNCRRLKMLQDKHIIHSIQGQMLAQEHHEFLERMSNLTGQKIGIHNCFQIADYIEAVRRINLTLPLWLEQAYDESKTIELEFLRLLTGIEMSDLELKTELQIGMGGNLLNELVDRMELKIDCLKAENVSKNCSALRNLKTYVYSSHDITLTGLFGALDMEFLDGDRDALPEFSSLLLIELLKRVDTDEFVIKWKYRRMSVLNGTLVELDVPYNTIETLRQRAGMIKALPDPQTWCDNLAISVLDINKSLQPGI